MSTSIDIKLVILTTHEVRTVVGSICYVIVHMVAYIWRLNSSLQSLILSLVGSFSLPHAFILAMLSRVSRVVHCAANWLGRSDIHSQQFMPKTVLFFYISSAMYTQSYTTLIITTREQNIFLTNQLIK